MSISSLVLDGGTLPILTSRDDFISLQTLQLIVGDNQVCSHLVISLNETIACILNWLHDVSGYFHAAFGMTRNPTPNLAKSEFFAE